MENCLEELQQNIACRNKEIITLYSLISSKACMPQSIFAFGHSSTGKSLVIRSLLQHLKYNFAIVDCVENPTIKHLLERVICELWQNTPSTETVDESALAKCNNIFEFTTILQKFASQHKSNIVIVFENSSRLRDLDSTFLPALLCLQKLSHTNVCVILETDIAFEKFKIKNDLPKPIKVYFPEYTREEVSEILLKCESKNVDLEIYQPYLNLFLSIYYTYCRDLRELRHMSRLNFEKYIEPIRLGECNKTDSRYLWSYMRPIFKSNLEVIYLRIPAGQLLSQQNIVQNQTTRETFELVQSFELPYHSKFLLLAGFLASYVPAKLDRQLFRKEKSKKRNKANPAKKSNFFLIAAPHTFTLDRMLSIFCYIIHENVDVNAILLSQISTLCRLGLLTLTSLSKLDEPKYKCSVDIEFMEVIAAMVDCNIRHFLNAI